MKVKFEKPLTKGYCGCLNCGVTPIKLTLNSLIAAGFGLACIKRNGKVIYQEDTNAEKYPRLNRFELMARKRGGDWRFELNLPLRNAEYQRQGKNNWVLIKSGMGFA